MASAAAAGAVVSPPAPRVLLVVAARAVAPGAAVATHKLDSTRRLVMDGYDFPTLPRPAQPPPCPTGLPTPPPTAPRRHACPYRSDPGPADLPFLRMPAQPPPTSHPGPFRRRPAHADSPTRAAPDQADSPSRSAPSLADPGLTDKPRPDSPSRPAPTSLPKPALPLPAPTSQTTKRPRHRNDDAASLPVLGEGYLSPPARRGGTRLHAQWSAPSWSPRTGRTPASGWHRTPASGQSARSCPTAGRSARGQT